MLHDEYDMTITNKLVMVIDSTVDGIINNWLYLALSLILTAVIIVVETKIQKHRKPSTEFLCKSQRKTKKR